MSPPAYGHHNLPEGFTKLDNFVACPGTDIKAKQAAGALHLLAGQLILRKRFIKGKENAFHPGMCFEIIGDFPGSGGDAVEPRWHGPQSPDQEPGIERLDADAGIEQFALKDLF